jgi:hypothetical protein
MSQIVFHVPERDDVAVGYKHEQQSLDNIRFNTYAK